MLIFFINLLFWDLHEEFSEIEEKIKSLIDDIPESKNLMTMKGIGLIVKIQGKIDPPRPLKLIHYLILTLC